MTKILIISKEPVTGDPRGAGIRYFNFALYLSSFYDVTIIAPGKTEGESFKIERYSTRNLARHLKNADICIYDGSRFFSVYPLLAKFKGRLIIDLFPSLFEDRLYLPSWAYLRQQIKYKEMFKLGDSFLVLNQAAKEYFSKMAGQKRIDVVPFGLSGEFKHKKNVMKGVLPAIGLNDKVLLSYGRLASWYDPITLIKAYKLLDQSHPGVKLVFLGAGNVDRLQSKQLNDRLSTELDTIKDKAIFIDWVDYAEVGNYLLEADIAAIAHLPSDEAKYSFRIRALDLIKAKLPFVISEGGMISDLIKAHGGGAVIPAGDPQAMAQAAAKLLDDQKYYQGAKNALMELGRSFQWGDVLKPLKEICGRSSAILVKKPGLFVLLGYYVLSIPLEFAYGLLKVYDLIRSWIFKKRIRA